MENTSSQLTVVKCGQCGKVFVPPRYMCSGCGGEKLEETSISGEGKVYTYTTIRVPPQGFADQVPYDIAIIELPELLLTARMINSGKTELNIGDKVSFVNKDKGIYWFKHHS